MKDYRQAQIVRLDVLAQLYKRGYSYREMREEVMARLDLQAYSLETVHRDVKKLLDEWRKTRLENIDEAVQLELERLNEIVREAWTAWEKSKLDGQRNSERQVGVPNPESEGGDSGQASVITVKLERTSADVVNCGDPRYLEIIHKALCERRKLLGLYAPEKREVSGQLNFGQLLMETGVITEDGRNQS